MRVGARARMWVRVKVSEHDGMCKQMCVQEKKE